MNVDVINEMDAYRVFVLRDYAAPTRYWRVEVRPRMVTCAQEGDRADGAPVHGLLEQWNVAGTRKTMGFLSASTRESFPSAPDYSKHLLLIIDGRLLGDGLGTPKIRFRKGFFQRTITVNADDGFFFEMHYSAPWIREIFRKLNLGGTPEYDPVDFIERLVEIVVFNRPHWIDIR